MKKYIRLISVSDRNRPKREEMGMHGRHFRDFVQMMLCHAWSAGFLEPCLWADIPDIATAAEVHDIGKTMLPEMLIKKNGSYSTSEKELVKRHTIFGAVMIELAILDLQSDSLYEYACEICRHHHERVDGQGYPDGLRGKEIPAYVQIVSLADVYDSLCSPCSYHRSVTGEIALDMIRSGECGFFEPSIIGAFAPVIEDFWRLAHTLAEDPDCNK